MARDRAQRQREATASESYTGFLLTLHPEFLFDIGRLVERLLVAVVPDRDVRAGLGVRLGDSQSNTGASCSTVLAYELRPMIPIPETPIPSLGISRGKSHTGWNFRGGDREGKGCPQATGHAARERCSETVDKQAYRNLPPETIAVLPFSENKGITRSDLGAGMLSWIKFPPSMVAVIFLS